MQAELHLDFAAGAEATSFRCYRQDPPWKVVRGFALETGECLVHLNNVSGGIFGGDSLKLAARLHPEAQAQITTTGATRVYRPRPQASEASLISEFHLGRDASLEYLPDALIPFRQARVFQRTSFTLEEGATLFCWDTIAPGRAAAGELFEYNSLKIVSEIQAQGVPILTDRMMIEPQRWSVRAAARFGQSNYLVTFVAMRAGMNAKEVSVLEDRLLSVVSNSDDVSFWGVSSLPAHGIMVRGMVSASVRIPATLQALWSAAKQQICDRAAVAPRKTY